MSDNYLVLARKYRPSSFADLRGQDFMVKTIVNSIKLNRVAHTFLLTGIRGGGKTTTARIIAKTLNCADPIINENLVLPCCKCTNCEASLSGNHPDIIELDAASRTGVDDMRSIIENTQYMPLLGKYKVYIIDEVHMLSTSAFNSLLKTLEEPPAHVKFIFATTELRKVPVTILSRCQKFELRRLNLNQLVSHLEDILSKEQIESENEALQIIALHAEGSVRDSLSLLDLVISNSNKNKITKDQVKDLLGLNDNSQIINLFSAIIEGDTRQAIELVKDFYYSGKDLLALPSQLMDLVHKVSKLKLNLDINKLEYSEEELGKISHFAEKLSVEVLTILWQMLSKSVVELQHSSNTLVCSEMIMIRLCHLNNLPTPSAIIEKIKSSHSSISSNSIKNEILESKSKIQITNFEQLVQIFYDNREMLLYHYLVNDVHLVDFEPNKIKIRQKSTVPHNFAAKVTSFLHQWTGEKWLLTVTSDDGAPTLSTQAELVKLNEIEELSKNEIVQEVLHNFPQAKVVDVTS